MLECREESLHLKYFMRIPVLRRIDELNEGPSGGRAMGDRGIPRFSEKVFLEI
jgi:hypothetical protein